MTIFTGTITHEGNWQAGALYEALGSCSISAAVATADTFVFTNILPVNDVEIVDFEVYGSDLDTNATPTGTLTAGDGTDVDGYMASKTAGGADEQYFRKGDGVLVGGNVNPASRNIILTLGGTVATAASSGTIYVRVRYRCLAA